MSEPIKHCANPECGKALVRHEGEFLTNWRKRRSCDRHCAQKIPRICRNCGKPLAPREGEKACDFQARTTCDTHCRHELQRGLMVRRYAECAWWALAEWPPGVHFEDNAREAARPFMAVRLRGPETIVHSLVGCASAVTAEHRNAGL